MLPNRKSAPAPRAHIAAEVRVPSEGTWFAALAVSVRPDGLFLSTFRELPAGTAVVVELSLPDGPAIVDGIVEPSGEAGVSPVGPGVRVAFDSLAEEMRTRIEAASHGSPPISGVTSKVA